MLPERFTVARLAVVEKRVATVPTVVEALLRTVCPVTVRLVDDALLRTVRPEIVRAVADALARVACPVTPNVPATPRRYAGVVEPIPTLPLAKIVKSDAPVEEATLNGLSAVEVEDCTLKAKDDDVALIPATVPLSRSVDVPSVDAVSQRVAKPREPPSTPAPMTPSVEVDTHLVVVPVVWRIIPRVPVALDESRKKPERVRLVVVALVILPLVAKSVVAVSADDDALFKTVSPETVSAVADAFVAKRVFTVPTVVEALLRTVSPVTESAVAVAFPSVVCPLTLRVPDEVSPVVDALPSTV
jgi:hypothetical protein